MHLFSFAELAEALALPPLAALSGGVTSVSTDTRALVGGELFVALRGDTFDGHDFVGRAFAAGARAAVVDVEYARSAQPGVDFPEGALLCAVNDTLVAYGELARHHRRRFSIPVVAVAGAAGKTSTKERIAQLLAKKYDVHYTAGNYNNRVGVPATLLGLREHHRVAVIEIGTNMPGEIDLLSRITEPTHGIITSIGKEHLEGLIDLDGVLYEETALFRFLATGGGVSFVNADDELLCRGELPPRAITYGFAAAEALWKGRVEEVRQGHELIAIHEPSGRQLHALMPIPGHFASANALAATAVAATVGLELELIEPALQELPRVADTKYARMRVEHHGLFTVLNDCYNANPLSMRAALDAAQSMSVESERWLVLGEMRELGASSAAEHRELIAEVVARGDHFRGAILMGTEFAEAARANPSDAIFVADSHQEAARMLLGKARPGALVLLKGSRGMKMENVLDFLE